MMLALHDVEEHVAVDVLTNRSHSIWLAPRFIPRAVKYVFWFCVPFPWF